MTEPVTQPLENKQRLWAIFDRLLPLIDSLADKLRFLFILGALLVIWIVFWLFQLKHFSLTITLMVFGLTLLPLLVLLRFWWALEELKDLPEIAGQMLGDAKSEIKEKAQQIRQQPLSKLSFLGTSKGLWSLAGLLSEVKEIAGSYLSIGTLINPFMLILGVISLVCVGLLAVVSIVLVFFAI